jgi:hypothetical protein
MEGHGRKIISFGGHTGKFKKNQTIQERDIFFQDYTVSVLQLPRGGKHSQIPRKQERKHSRKTIDVGMGITANRSSVLRTDGAFGWMPVEAKPNFGHQTRNT